MTGRDDAWAQRACWPCCKCGAPKRAPPLLLLDGFEIVDDRADLVGLEDEFRHVRVAGRNALGQRLGKPFDLKLAREGTKGRRLGVGTDAAAADRMAAD